MDDWHPRTHHQTRLLRAQLLRNCRAFFDKKAVLEVETPALSQAANTDPYIESFKFQQGNQQRYLHTSPEYPMKRLLAAGSGDIYQICKVWREGEVGKNHNPEFTLLEWYRLGFSYHQLIHEVSELLHLLLPELQKKDKILSYQDLFLEKFSINPHIASQHALITCVAENIPGLSVNNLNRQDLLDALLSHCIEPDFSDDCLTFIIDYPATQSALASIRQEQQGDKDCAIAERFEVYVGQQELGNGYQEETDYQRNRQILESENQQRKKKQLGLMTYDQHFLEAMKHGIPECAGVAVGLDRVLMLASGEDSIQKVINFPWDVA